MITASIPFKADSKKMGELVSPLTTQTEEGKVLLEDVRAMTVTEKEVARRARTMCGPRLPPAWEGKGGQSLGWMDEGMDGLGKRRSWGRGDIRR